ncbi:endonuclease domain-containing protein [Streptomyces sp. NPDC005134]|uniref:endonuclease domain-containing protein n=1 Tax=unclassified Streptomyces TaxID=2593676 RepID=UPI0033A36FFF
MSVPAPFGPFGISHEPTTPSARIAPDQPFASSVDHSHRSGLVRGVLCYNCSHVEAPHARQVMLNIERANRCWFQSY